MPDASAPEVPVVSVLERRRRRRWWRPRSLLLALGALVLVFGVWQAWWRLTAEPAPVVDYYAELEALAASYQPEGENAWPLFLDALERHDAAVAEVSAERTWPERDPGDPGQVDFTYVGLGEIDPEFHARELLALDRLRESGAERAFAELVGKPRFVRPLAHAPRPATMIMLPELAHARSAAKGRAAAMRIAAEAGDHARQAAAFEQALALARILGSQALLVDRLVAEAIHAMVLEELRREIDEGLVPPDAARTMLAALDRQALPPARLMFEGERLSCLSMIQHCFTDDGHGDGRLDPKALAQLTGAAPAPASGLASLLLAGRAETTRLAEQHFAGLIDNVSMPPLERRAHGYDDGAFVAELPMTHVFLRTMLPAVGRAVEMADVAEAQRAAARIDLALEIHRRTHGALPDALDALTPDILDEIPADPITGGALVYRRLDDGSFLLYSVGLDGTDDSAAATGPDAPTFSDEIDEPGTDRLLDVAPRPKRDP